MPAPSRPSAGGSPAPVSTTSQARRSPRMNAALPRLCERCRRRHPTPRDVVLTRCCSVIIGVVEPSEPRRQPLDRDLELRVEVDELAKPFRHPREAAVLGAASRFQLFDAAVGEVHRYANAAATSSACCCSCRWWLPAAGEDEAGRVTGTRVRPSTCGRFSDMDHQAPWFAGSSCTQRTSASAGYAANATGSVLTGSGYSRSTRTIATSVAPRLVRSARRSQ